MKIHVFALLLPFRRDPARADGKILPFTVSLSFSGAQSAQMNKGKFASVSPFTSLPWLLECYR